MLPDLILQVRVQVLKNALMGTCMGAWARSLSELSCHQHGHMLWAEMSKPRHQMLQAKLNKVAKVHHLA